jgi:hypothetical protein
MNADRQRGERGGSVVPTAISRNFSSMSKFLTMERRARELKSMCELVWLQANFRVLYVTKAFSFKEIRSSTDHDVESWIHLHQTK